MAKSETIRARCTETMIRAFPFGSRERLISDTATANLYLAVGGSKKAWRWNARGCGKITIGSFPAVSLADARDRAAEFNRLKALGHDPKQELARIEEAARKEAAETAMVTLDITVTNWIADKRRRNRARKSIHEYERIIRRNLVDRHPDKPISELSRGDIKAALDAMIERGAGAGSNKALIVIRQFLDWCVSEELIQSNPATSIKSVEVRVDNDRALSVRELALVYRAAEHLDANERDAIRLLILTGARKLEGCALAMQDVSNGVWTLPPSDWTDAKGNTYPVSHSKTEREHPMPLPPLALGCLAGRRDRTFAFHDQPHRYMMPDLAAHADAAVREHLGVESEPWGCHDIRAGVRTALSSDEMDELLEREGRGETISEQDAETTLNHALGKLNRTYNKSRYQRRIGRILAAWERLLKEEIDRQTGDNIVPIKAA